MTTQTRTTQTGTTQTGTTQTGQTQAGRSPLAQDLETLIRTRVPGRSLDAPFYTSQAAFDLDVDAIFASHWIFVATEAELPEPGDYLTVEVGTASVIVVRDDDEDVRAFHNVCRHRGSRILDAGRGEVGNLVCPYHRWTYGVDGRLMHAESQPPGFDRSCFGLKTVAVASVAGLVFICLADAPPTDFEEVRSVIEPYLAPYGLASLKVAAQIDLVEDGNWKLVMENNRECYHCDGHPELLSAYFPLFGYDAEDITPRLRPIFDRFTAAGADLRATSVASGFPVGDHRELDSRVTGFQISHIPLDGAGESFGDAGGSVCRKLVGSMASARFGDLSLHMQPNSWFHMLADHAVVFSVLPLAPDRSLLRTTWLVNPDAVEGVDYDLGTMTGVWQATNNQDRELVARTQLGVGDPGYVPGPYSMVEDDVEAFVSWYVSRLRNHLDS